MLTLLSNTNSYQALVMKLKLMLYESRSSSYTPLSTYVTKIERASGAWPQGQAADAVSPIVNCMQRRFVFAADQSSAALRGSNTLPDPFPTIITFPTSLHLSHSIVFIHYFSPHQS